MSTLPVYAIDRLRMATDGEGVTTLVGSYGCPMRCRWCFNREAYAAGTRTRAFTVEQLISELSIDGLYFAATNGGVTFGGGEPLLHAPFLRDFADARPSEWSMNLETCLNVPEAQLRPLLSTDARFIVDIKDLSSDIYLDYTGLLPDRMRSNLRLLADACPERVHVRVPSIPQFNTEEDTRRSERTLRALGFTDIEHFTYVIRKNGS